MLSDIISMGTTLLYTAFVPVLLVLLVLFLVKKITKKVLWTGIKIAVVVYLAVTLVVPMVTGCGNADTTALESSYESKVTRLGSYEGLVYTDESDREPTDDEVQEEMEAIMLWFEDGELTDEWIRENMSYTSLEDFRENTRINLREVYKEQAWQSSARELFETVIAESEFDLDQAEVNKEYQHYLDSYQQYADMMELPLEEFVAGELECDMEEFQEKGTYAAEMILKTDLVAQAIIKAEKLDTEASYERIAKQIVEEEGYDSVEELEEAAGGKNSLMVEVRYRVAAEYMLEHGNPQKE